MFGRKEGPPSIIEREVFAEEEWFRAFYEGNSLIPLADEGISLCTIATIILEDPNIDWWKFIHSELSPKQISRLGNAMSAQHKHKGVAISNQAQSETFTTQPRIIEKARFEQLWGSVTLGTITELLQYILDKNSVRREPEMIKQIEKFFGDIDRNGARIEQFKKALAVIKTNLYESPIKDILTEYREGFRTDVQANRRKWTDVYLPRLKETLIDALTKSFNGNLPLDIKNFVNRLGWHEPFD